MKGVSLDVRGRDLQFAGSEILNEAIYVNIKLDESYRDIEVSQCNFYLPCE